MTDYTDPLSKWWLENKTKFALMNGSINSLAMLRAYVAETQGRVLELETQNQWLRANLCAAHQDMNTCSSGPCAMCRAETVEAELAEARRDSARLEHQYSDLVNALCSPSWMGRNRHESVVGLAKRLRDKQQHIVALESESAVGYCVRSSKHVGPCNGLPREDCDAMAEAQPKEPA